MSPLRIVDLSKVQQFTAINLLADGGAVGGPVVIPNAIKVMPVWTLGDGKTARNVLYGQAQGSFTPTAAAADAILTALGSGAAWTALAAFLSVNLSLARVELQDVRTANNVIVSSTGAGHPGTSAANNFPDEVAVVVSLRTALTGPRYRGRMFLPGWTSQAMAGGNVVSAGAITAVNNWAATIFTALSAEGLTWCLGLRQRQEYVGVTGTTHPARVATTQQILTASVRDNHWDTMRRRGLK